MKQQNRNSRKNAKGFTLVELTVAMVVLTVGVLGGMIMIVLGMTRDNTSRMDTTATNAAQAVLEAISAVPANNNVTLPLTDCANNNFSVTTAGATGGGLGATLAGNGTWISRSLRLRTIRSTIQFAAAMVCKPLMTCAGT